MMELEHLSYSSLSAYQTCGRYWKFKYLDKISSDSTPSLVFGSAIHNTVEDIIARNTLGRDAIDPVEFFKKDFAAQIERNRSESGEIMIDWQGSNESEQMEIARRLLTCAPVMDEIKKLRCLVIDGEAQIERKITLNVPGVPVPLIGFIDIILGDFTPADFKTAARSWTQEQAEKSLQSLVYIAAMSQMELPVNWKFKHIVMVKTATPKLQILEHKHEASELFFLYDYVREIWRGIEAGVFVPNPDCWKCSPKWCEYYSICRG